MLSCVPPPVRPIVSLSAIVLIVLGACAVPTTITKVPAAAPTLSPIPVAVPMRLPVPPRGSDLLAGPKRAPSAVRPAPLLPVQLKAPPPMRQWTYAPAGPTFGLAGTVRNYRVAVEAGVNVSAGTFAAVVNGTLSDPRSWIAGGNVRFHQVGAGTLANFTVWLASPRTAQRICAASGVDITVNGVPYTSCRGGNNVVINSDRYLYAVPSYGAPLSVYRNYAINHEVGHWLGHGHELCPGAGMPAPVMQQQTFGLQGCVAYGWPYLNGVRYSGPPTGG
jgi:hypothetical protein